MFCVINFFSFKLNVSWIQIFDVFSAWMINVFVAELCIRWPKRGRKKPREEVAEKRCNITRVEKDRNIDTSNGFKVDDCKVL